MTGTAYSDMRTLFASGCASATFKASRSLTITTMKRGEINYYPFDYYTGTSLSASGG